MRAAVTVASGGPIEFQVVPDSERQAGEVLVRVEAAAMNRLDRAVFEGQGLGTQARFPLIQGIDAAGTIESGAGSLAAGTRVVVKPAIACRSCFWCRSGQDAACSNTRMFGIHRPGGFAELLSVPRQNIAVIPAGLSAVEAAAAAHCHTVVMNMIRSAGGITPGDLVMVTGAGGGLGTAAVQIASAMGAKTLAVASSAEKLAAAGDCGAAVVVNRTAHPRFSDAAFDVSGGVGAQLALDTTGDGSLVAEGLRGLARGGAVVVVAARPGASLDLNLRDLYRNRRSLIGTSGSNLVDFTDTFRFLAEHDIHPVIGRTYPLSRTADAMEAVTDGDRVGRIVVEVRGQDED